MKKSEKYLIYTLILLLSSTSVFAAGQMCLRCAGTYIPFGLVTLSRNVIMIIQMLVPVIIIITGIIELLKAVMAGDEKKMDEVKPKLIRKFIAGIFIFLIFTIVKFGFSFLNDYNDTDNVLRCVSVFITEGTGGEHKETCPSRGNNFSYPADSDEAKAADYCERYCTSVKADTSSSSWESCLNSCKNNYSSEHSEKEEQTECEKYCTAKGTKGNSTAWTQCIKGCQN